MNESVRERLLRSAVLASAIVILAALLGTAGIFVSVADAYRHRASLVGLLAERKSRLDPDRREFRLPRHADILALFPLRARGSDEPLGAGLVVSVRVPEGEFPALVLLDAAGGLVALTLIDASSSPAGPALAAAALRKAGGKVNDIRIENRLGPGVADRALEVAETRARDAWLAALASPLLGASR